MALFHGSKRPVRATRATRAAAQPVSEESDSPAEEVKEKRRASPKRKVSPKRSPKSDSEGSPKARRSSRRVKK